MSTNQKFTHKLIAATAKEMAAAWYEEAAHDNQFYAFYPSQKKFMKREWHRFVEAARLTLSKMLGFSTTPDYMKEEIFDALIKHSEMPGNIDLRIAKDLTPPTVSIN